VSETQSKAVGALETPEEVAYELRAAEASMWTGGRLLIGVFAFAFAGLAFAYFYLRTANSADLWRPPGVSAPTGPGLAVMVCTVAATVLNVLGIVWLRRNRSREWEVLGWSAVAAGVAALGLQCWELTDLPFFPGRSGYSSVFIGWAALNIVVLVAGVYWNETILARHARLRSAHEAEGGTPGGMPMRRITRIQIEAAGNFWVFIAGVGVFFWIFFYLAR
jgi:heme/copper-type cytochrome/quinol oxidase subunit 3